MLCSFVSVPCSTIKHSIRTSCHFRKMPALQTSRNRTKDGEIWHCVYTVMPSFVTNKFSTLRWNLLKVLEFRRAKLKAWKVCGSKVVPQVWLNSVNAWLSWSPLSLLMGYLNYHSQLLLHRTKNPDPYDSPEQLSQNRFIIDDFWQKGSSFDCLLILSKFDMGSRTTCTVSIGMVYAKPLQTTAKCI